MRCSVIPCEMIRGSAATDGQFAYFTLKGTKFVYSYEYSTGKWEEITSCPFVNSGLAIISRRLTCVGGKGESRTNKLFTLQQWKWVEEYPPIKTARSSPAVVSTTPGEYLFVIGGVESHWTSTVELFQVASRTWYEISDIPEPLPFPSATICRDEIYVIGTAVTTGYSCSFQALQSHNEPIRPQSLSWECLPKLPVTDSTATSLCGRLVLVGGVDFEGITSSIYQLDDEKFQWIGSMENPRSWCLTASPSPEEILIVGGLQAGNLLEELNVKNLHVQMSPEAPPLSHHTV